MISWATWILDPRHGTMSLLAPGVIPTMSRHSTRSVFLLNAKIRAWPIVGEEVLQRSEVRAQRCARSLIIRRGPERKQTVVAGSVSVP